MKKILSVVGARPNFMKMAPVHKALSRSKSKVIHKIVHTGQHYDRKMSDVFFRDLALPRSDIYLGVGSRSHAEQVAHVMTEFEKIVDKEKPDLVIVYGDVNSTAAAALVVSKSSGKNGKPVKLAHVESGLRSFDRSMPEEINRKIADMLSDFLFVTEPSGLRNLHAEGISRDKIFFTGNTMIDSLKLSLGESSKSKILKDLCLSESGYAIATIHRPSNTDSKPNLEKLLRIFSTIGNRYPEIDIVFSVHPRTVKMIDRFSLKKIIDRIPNLIITEPLGYFDFLRLTSKAKFILTDSGGIQEEAAYLKIPCLTLRENTERPVTAEIGTNVICGLDEKFILRNVRDIMSGKFRKGKVPKLWDGHAAERIVKIILEKI